MKIKIEKLYIVVFVAAIVWGCSDDNSPDIPDGLSSGRTEIDCPDESIDSDTLNAFFISSTDRVPYNHADYEFMTDEVIYQSLKNLVFDSQPNERDLYIMRKLEYGDTVGVPKEWHVKSLAVTSSSDNLTYSKGYDKLTDWEDIDVPNGCTEFMYDWFNLKADGNKLHCLFRKAYNADPAWKSGGRYIKVVIEGVSSLGKPFVADGVIHQPFDSREEVLSDYLECSFTCDTTVGASAQDFEVVSKYDPVLYEKIYGHPNTHKDWAQNPEHKGLRRIDEMSNKVPADWKQWYERLDNSAIVLDRYLKPLMTTYNLGWAQIEIVPAPGDIRMKVKMDANPSPNPRAIRVIATGHRVMNPLGIKPDGESGWVPLPDYDYGSFMIYQEGKK